MRTYLLLFLSTLFLLFAMPKNNSVLRSTQQAELKEAGKYCKRTGKPCPKKCLRHQTIPNQQHNEGIATDCGQQLYAIVDLSQADTLLSFTTTSDYVLPHIRKHLSPVLEHEPEPPRFA
ncbi:hypothetical protein [Pontibacter burrus]|uniref:Uncharacterized protein n=1 Tax=Pontibacter burrus TaxID=2704466 RepID=A0A6B3LTB2_9BACT|nr:hypothetical protein [Pontibacter burrus]NEM99063.1 hypothetical protein [Pontibacter burrus]